MNLPAQLFAADWLLLANLMFGYFLFVAVRRAPWKIMLGNPAMINALVGLTFGVFLMWQFNAGIRPGFNFHILGSTLFVLMFGWQIASVALTLVMLATWLRMGFAPASLGLNGLIMIALPVMFTHGLLRFSKRKLPKNLFLFVLFNGFGCAAFGIVLIMLATTLVLLGSNNYTWTQIQYHLLIPAPIIMFAEAFATGMLTTAFTVSQPEAMMNFSVEEYLTGK